MRQRPLRRLAIWGAVGLALILMPVVAWAQGGPTDGVVHIKVEAYDTKAKVWIYVTEGSGIVLNPDGQILTARHVLQYKSDEIPGDRRYTVYLNEGATAVMGEVDQCAVDPVDACILTILSSHVVTAGITEFPILSCARLKRLDAILVAATDPDMSLNTPPGLISNPQANRNYYGSTVVLRPGMSGGAVFDAMGRLTAIVSGVAPDAQGFAFLTPIVRAKSIVQCSDVASADDGDSITEVLKHLGNASSTRQPELADALAKAGAFLRRADAQDAGTEQVIAALVKLYIDTDFTKSVSRETRLAIVSALAEVRPESWRSQNGVVSRNDVARSTRYYVYQLAYVKADAEFEATLKELKRRINYIVTPGALVSISPFRIRMTKCPFESCSVEVGLIGTTEGGPSIQYPTQLISNKKTEDHVDISDRQTANNYVIPIGLEEIPVPVSYQISCTDLTTGIRADRGAGGFKWNASDDAGSGYAIWFECGMGDVEVAVGFAVNLHRQLPPPGSVRVTPPVVPN